MQRESEAHKARTKKLGRKATLERLRTGPTQGVDIIGEPPEVVLDALLQGVTYGFTAAVRSHDDALPKRLQAAGARVWVGPPPNAEERIHLGAFQEAGVLQIFQESDGSEERSWVDADEHSHARHQLNLRDFAPFDGVSVASSLDALPTRKRKALERRVYMSPEAFIRETALLMTLFSALPVLGVLIALGGFGFLMWRLSNDGSLLLPGIILTVGVLVLLSTRLVNDRLEALLGSVDEPDRGVRDV